MRVQLMPRVVLFGLWLAGNGAPVHAQAPTQYVQTGGWLCENLQSINRMLVGRNNPHMPRPGDCIQAPRNVPLRSVTATQFQFSRVEIVGGMYPMYALNDDLRFAIPQEKNAEGAEYDWWTVGEGPDGQPSVKVDRASIRKTGSLVRMWHMSNYTKDQKLGAETFRSLKAHVEYDCKGNRLRTLSSSAWSGGMATGKLVNSDSNADDFESVKPGTLARKRWEYACSRP
jgi:hypothetical protein